MIRVETKSQKPNGLSHPGALRPSVSSCIFPERQGGSSLRLASVSIEQQCSESCAAPSPEGGSPFLLFIGPLLVSHGEPSLRAQPWPSGKVNAASLASHLGAGGLLCGSEAAEHPLGDF